jgi:lipoprotein-anchoring transpeptidase ErfK/SrfK
VVSPDLSAPWVMQLGHKPGRLVRRRDPAGIEVQPIKRHRPDAVRTSAVRAPAKRQAAREINPIYLPQQVAYRGGEKPGTIIIDTTDNFLYLVESNGQARRYGVGTGKPGFEWAGTHKISRKAEWPDWRPPSQMIARERAKGHYLPTYLPGGPENPLGARALYLGSTLYRIHGTNQPWTIGGSVSSGCIRMRNEDVVDLYGRVAVGAKVVVM